MEGHARTWFTPNAAIAAARTVTDRVVAAVAMFRTSIIAVPAIVLFSASPIDTASAASAPLPN